MSLASWPFWLEGLRARGPSVEICSVDQLRWPSGWATACGWRFAAASCAVVGSMPEGTLCCDLCFPTASGEVVLSDAEWGHWASAVPSALLAAV
eukprot:1585394-Amphidinium_carterae.1